jgi:hypothetical protein
VTQRRLARATDLIRGVLLLATLVVLVLGDVEATLTLGLVAVTAVAVRFVRAPAAAELCFVVLAGIDAALNAAGAFDTFNRQDTFGHFVLPAAIVPIVWTALQRAGVRIEQPQALIATAAAHVLVVSVIVALGSVWELVEWACDLVFPTDLSPGYADTIHDIGFDTAGAIVGALLWVRAPAAGTVRRTEGGEAGEPAAPPAEAGIRS